MYRFNRAQRQRRGGQRGFTLIELLVVIAVLAILAAVVLFNVAGVKNKGNNAACQADVKSVQAAVDSYSSDVTPTANGLVAENIAGNPNGTDAKLLAPKYLHHIPDPLSSCTSITITPTTTGFDVAGISPDGTKYFG